MRDGYLALKRNGIWSLVTLPPNTKPIACKWVFKVKENMDGTIHKYKARLVAKGFHQVAGFDFTEMVSHVVKPTSIIIVLIVAITNGWNRTKLDVNNVFLNGDLKEDLYMMQSSGFETPQASNRVCKHHKALHGLKQSPRAWFDKLYNKFWIYFSLVKSISLCQDQFPVHYLSFSLADDILITGNDQLAISLFVQDLNREFALKDFENSVTFFGH